MCFIRVLQSFDAIIEVVIITMLIVVRVTFIIVGTMPFRASFTAIIAFIFT